jgi:tagatose-6-phosphate ketose/aldose isomerase
MNAFERLLRLPAAEAAERGVAHTPREIYQQPATWARAVEQLEERREELRGFLEDCGVMGDGESVVILTGAGSSDFVGAAVAPLLRARLGREVISIPTTHLVTHAGSTFSPRHSYTLISFARSGNSPESLATYRLVGRIHPSTRHLIVTCNRDGALARAASTNSRALCVTLPEETNDRSLVMTSSYSTMAMTAVGLGHLDSFELLKGSCAAVGGAAQRVVQEYGDLLEEFAGIPFARACFLGSGVLRGTMRECGLKMQEMTDGRVVAQSESFLGLRHGPQVFVDESCVVVAALAGEPAVRRYELDLLRELKRKKQGCATLAICSRLDAEIEEVTTHTIELFPDGESAPDGFRIMTDVVVGQILGTFKSLSLGLKPDSPSAGGVIHRVVRGVTIYEP